MKLFHFVTDPLPRLLFAAQCQEKSETRLRCRLTSKTPAYGCLHTAYTALVIIIVSFPQVFYP